MTTQLDLLDEIEATADETDKSCVYAVIREVARRGQPFSSNDCRGLFPVLKSNAVVGACFAALRNEGVIRRHGKEFVMSTDPRTRHHVAVWIAA